MITGASYRRISANTICVGDTRAQFSSFFFFFFFYDRTGMYRNILSLSSATIPCISQLYNNFPTFSVAHLPNSTTMRGRKEGREEGKKN